jgi:hypothetical protein
MPSNRERDDPKPNIERPVNDRRAAAQALSGGPDDF